MYRGKTISVAIASYNGDKYIREQLESILNQTVLPDEIVISDDGSTDKTLCILREFSSSASSFCITTTVLTDNPRHGFAFNFGYAVGHCSGDIVFICDQDDVWLPDKIEHIANVYLNKKDALCVFHNAASVDYQGKPINIVFNKYIEAISQNISQGESIIRLSGEKYCEMAASVPFVNGMVMSVSKELLETAYPFPPISSQHDGWLLFCALTQDKCYYLDEVLTLRRLHNQNTSGAGKQGLGINRIRKIVRNIEQHNNYSKNRILYAKFMKDYLLKYCGEDSPIAKRAFPTISRIQEIGTYEIEAAESGRVLGTIRLSRLFIRDKRYRRSGVKLFLYELADIILFSKHERTRRMQLDDS